MVLAVPAWATNIVPGQFDTSALFNTVGNNGTFLTNPPMFKGYQSAAQSIPNTSLTALSIDTTIVDTYGGHSNTVNNSRYTCQTGTAGWYLFGGSVGFAANGSGDRVIELHKNGTIDKLSQSNILTPDAGVSAAIQAWTLIQLAVGDYVEAYAYQTTGGALNTLNTATGVQLLWIHA